MRLQIAIDGATGAEALAIADKIHDVIDIVEVGTPMILREGMSTVRALKRKYPALCVLADTKIVDGGDLESADACEAGADIVTVLALSDNETIRLVVEAAHRYGRKVMADLINVRDIPTRSKELMALGLDYICVHTAFDVQKLGKTPLDDLTELVSSVPSEMAAVAGGIKLSTLDAYKRLNPAIVIAGGSLASAPDIRQAVVEMQRALGKEMCL